MWMNSHRPRSPKNCSGSPQQTETANTFPSCCMNIAAYFGDSVTGTSVMLSTGSLLSSAALRTAASLGPS